MKDEVTNVLRLANLVRENVRAKQLFTLYNPILVTLSGGQDSICSLLLLYLLQNQLGLEFYARTKPALPGCSLCEQAGFGYPNVSRLIGRRLGRANRAGGRLVAERSSMGPKGLPSYARPKSLAAERLGCPSGNPSALAQPSNPKASGPAPRRAARPHRLNKALAFVQTSRTDRLARVASTRGSASHELDHDRPLGPSILLPLLAQQAEQVSDQGGSAESAIANRPKPLGYLAALARLGCPKGNLSAQQPNFRFSESHSGNQSWLARRASKPVGNGTHKISKTGVDSDLGPTGPEQTLLDFEKSAGLIGQFGLLWCNHFWQKESFHTMLHVAKVNLCFSSTMCFYLPIESVLCEQNAREWRHKSIQRTCAFFHYECCTQGHTKSDRVETILFNILRGTGIAGLQALQWKKSFYSFSCQRFYPRLSYYKLNWPQSTAPFLKLTQGLYKIRVFSKFCLVNVRTKPTFRLPTRCSYRPRQRLGLATVLGLPRQPKAAGFDRQPQAPPGHPLAQQAEQEVVTKSKALKACRALTRAKRGRATRRPCSAFGRVSGGRFAPSALLGLRPSIRRSVGVKRLGLEHYWLLRALLLDQTGPLGLLGCEPRR